MSRQDISIFKDLTQSYVFSFRIYFLQTLMSSDDQDDDITIVTSHSAEYAVSEPGSSPYRVKTSKTRLSEAETL